MKLSSTTQFPTRALVTLVAWLAVLSVSPNAVSKTTAASTKKLPSIADEVSALEKSDSNKQASQKLVNLPQVARQTMALHFSDAADGLPSEGTLDSYAESLHVDKRMNRSAGVFVTLTRDGKTRGCWGTVYPQYDSVAKATVYATIGALTKEYRFTPITSHEWQKLKPQVTVIRRVEPISSISSQDPLRDGLLVRSGGKSAVLLPGEATDAYYQLVQCKLKAGITSGESCQLYKLKVEIYD